MSKQGVLSYRIEGDPTRTDLTGVSGLAPFMDLACASGLVESIRRNVNACGDQGWSDAQLVMSLILLNLAGGECVDDLDQLESDEGLSKLVMKRVVLGGVWANRRMKAIRFLLINVPGRVLSKARQLYLRLSRDHPALELLVEMRRRICELAESPPIPAGT
jgi:hypothetical protein